MIYLVDMAAALINLASAAYKMENAIHLSPSISIHWITQLVSLTHPLNSNLSGGSAINTIYYDTIYLVHSAYQSGLSCSKGGERYPSDKSTSIG